MNAALKLRRIDILVSTLYLLQIYTDFLDEWKDDGSKY